MKKIRSAFKSIYLVVFLITTYHIVFNAPGSFDVNGSSQLDMRIFRAVSTIFLILVGIHSVRLYITLEMLDTEEYLFEKFFDGAKRIQKLLEFISRCAIIGVVSYKFISWSGGKDIHRYLFALYLSMLIWGMVVLSFRPYKETYLSISIYGLLISGVLFFLSDKSIRAWFSKLWPDSSLFTDESIHNSVAVWSLAIAFFCFFFARDIFTDIRKNGAIYSSYVKDSFKTLFE